MAFFSVCGGRFQDASGVISSPMYPNTYPKNMDCVYIIQPQTGQRIRIDFHAFYLEADSKCSFDYLQVSNTAPHHLT